MGFLIILLAGILIGFFVIPFIINHPDESYQIAHSAVIKGTEIYNEDVKPMVDKEYKDNIRPSVQKELDNLWSVINGN